MAVCLSLLLQMDLDYCASALHVKSKAVYIWSTETPFVSPELVDMGDAGIRVVSDKDAGLAIRIEREYGDLEVMATESMLKESVATC
jgi:uncharacterized protein YjfI (DUF2170 family)